MPRRQTAAQTAEQIRKITATMFQPMSPEVKTGLVAALVFFVVVGVFAPKAAPQKFYTGCELSGAIEDCAAIMSEYTASRNFSSYDLPLERGEPSREDQVRASLTQRNANNMHRDRISMELAQQKSDAYRRAKEKKWGVKDHD
jgi:hypothetical protein